MPTYAKLQNADSIEVVDIRAPGPATPTFTQGLQTDTISEKTSATGVTIDGLLIKDSAINITFTDWTPTLSVPGSMTYTGTTISTARYFQMGKFVAGIVNFTGTIGGTVSNYISFTLPVTAKSSQVGTGFGYTLDNSILVGIFLGLGSTTVFNVYKYDYSNYTAGSVTTAISFFYEAA